MDSLRHIVLLGAGAVGVLPAEKLLKLPGITLTAAADKERVQRYRQDGIFFNGEKLPLSFAAPGEMSGMPPADLIIVATKTTTLSAALENVAPLTGSNTIFLPLLNGITAHEVIGRRFPGNTVLRGYFLGHASVREKNFIRHDGVGTFFCGGENTALTKVTDLFDQSGINNAIPENMDHAVWKKFILNVGINQTQAMFYADYGAVQRDAKLLDYCKNLMLEAAAVAQAENIYGTGEMISAAMEVILTMPENAKTSMLQDVLAHRPSEIDAFAGTLSAKAEKLGIPTPYNNEVLAEITRREKSYCRA
ncbi:MAG: ketopantoate reductase family protein [Lentisphaerae bacterium]|nr:ketopantoate reductase family protein [Lentisphaerota bacterium]